MHKIEPNIPKEILYAEKLVHWMDEAFKVPFLNFRFGLDPIIGLIPWVGDVVSFVISGLILKSLASAGMPKRLVWKMFGNIALDFGVGLVPFLGDAWDFFNKANRKNLKLARDYFEAQAYANSTPILTNTAEVGVSSPA
ncbi:MAG: hypothetical protein ACI9CU_000008 [Polaribacter sp.]|jgi:hypothetical protein